LAQKSAGRDRAADASPRGAHSAAPSIPTSDHTWVSCLPTGRLSTSIAISLSGVPKVLPFLVSPCAIVAMRPDRGAPRSSDGDGHSPSSGLTVLRWHPAMFANHRRGTRAQFDHLGERQLVPYHSFPAHPLLPPNRPLRFLPF